MQVTIVHTPLGFESGCAIPKSRNPPAGTATVPVAVQLCPVETWQLSAEFAIAPGPLPTRSVTVMVCACSENATSLVAEQPFGTQVRTAAVSDALWLVLFNE